MTMSLPRPAGFRPGRLLAAGLLLAASAAVAAPASALEPFNADYSARFMGMEAEGTMTLENTGGDRWEYRMEVAGMGARLVQSTTFQARDNRWRPLTSEDSQTGESGLAAMLVRNKSVRATYDWDNNVARWSGDVDADEAPGHQARERVVGDDGEDGDGAEAVDVRPPGQPVWLAGGGGHRSALAGQARGRSPRAWSGSARR